MTFGYVKVWICVHFLCFMFLVRRRRKRKKVRREDGNGGSRLPENPQGRGGGDSE